MVPGHTAVSKLGSFVTHLPPVSKKGAGIPPAARRGQAADVPSQGKTKGSAECFHPLVQEGCMVSSSFISSPPVLQPHSTWLHTTTGFSSPG